MLILKKSQQTTKKIMKNYPACKDLKSHFKHACTATEWARDFIFGSSLPLLP